jgi:hypothetical protein
LPLSILLLGKTTSLFYDSYVAWNLFYQDNRSRKALEALEKLNELTPKINKQSPIIFIVLGFMLLLKEIQLMRMAKLYINNDFCRVHAYWLNLMLCLN